MARASSNAESPSGVATNDTSGIPPLSRPIAPPRACRFGLRWISGIDVSERNGVTAIVSVRGDLDLATAPRLRDAAVTRLMAGDKRLVARPERPRVPRLDRPRHPRWPILKRAKTLGAEPPAGDRPRAGPAEGLRAHRPSPPPSTIRRPGRPALVPKATASRRWSSCGSRLERSTSPSCGSS